MSSDEEALQERADAALIRMFLGGDRAAFEALVMRHQDRLYAFCFRYFRSQEPAEEAAQEVWVKIFRSLDRFRGESKFSTWMFQVALNHCRNRSAWEGRRGKGKHDSLDAERDLGEGPGLKMQLADEQPGADEQLEVDERRRILHEEMAQLDPIWMEILLLRDVEGMSYDEIGFALDLAAGTVKSRIYRAREELRTRIRRRLLGEARRLGEAISV